MMAATLAPAAEQTAVKAIQYIEDVRRRQLTSFDVEKVFWNSVYGVGLVGTAYLALQFGNLLSGASKVMSEVAAGADALINPENASFDGYLMLYKWVEGEYRSKPVEYGGGGRTALAVTVEKFRSDPAAWESFKSAIAAKYPEEFKKASEVKASAAQNILDSFNSFFNEWGPILPLGVLGANVIFEYCRVRKMKNLYKEVGVMQ